MSQCLKKYSILGKSLKPLASANNNKHSAMKNITGITCWLTKARTSRITTIKLVGTLGWKKFSHLSRRNGWKMGGNYSKMLSSSLSDSAALLSSNKDSSFNLTWKMAEKMIKLLISVINVELKWKHLNSICSHKENWKRKRFVWQD